MPYEERLIKLEQRYGEIQEGLKNVKEMQATINNVEKALLGDYAKDSTGILEETRNLRREVNSLTNRQDVHAQKINECIEYKKVNRRVSKKLIAGLTLIVPVVFEAGKFIIAAIVGWFKIKS